ncbi:MAG: ComEC/Rec2 family competence protein [Puniceicoccales bacterium]|jgi:competence protein ComEC|nr:ComEC/Rec2 family competence protein [Puniceicoccales bacterium]
MASSDHIEFYIPKDNDDNTTPANRRGHLPLLWLLTPIAAVDTICFYFDLHAPWIGAVLMLLGGGSAAVLSFTRPEWKRLWAVSYLFGAAGVGLLIFAAQVKPLVNWEGLPPREASLSLRWKQVFTPKENNKTISGVARVIKAPALLPELVGCDIYCQLRKPLPEILLERNTVFTATGVLDTVRRELARPWRPAAGKSAVSAEEIKQDAASRENFLRYLEGRRVKMVLTRAELAQVEAEPSMFFLWCARKRDALESVLRNGMEERPESADLHAAILLRKTAGISREMRNDFVRTGTMHLFSVSGLHVSIIAAMLFYIGRLLRVPDAPWRIWVIVVMFIFVMITGGSAAALRAWLMAGCILAAGLVSRQCGPGAGWVLAATAVLFWEPELWLDVGFQLSYMVVGALIFYGIPLGRYLNEKWSPWDDLTQDMRRGWRRIVFRAKDWLTGSFGIGVAASLAGAPLVVSNFGVFSAGSLLANLVVVPLCFPVMWLGFTSIILGVLGLGSLALPFNWLASWNLWFLGAVVRSFSRIPGMALSIEYRAPWIGGVTTLLMLTLFLVLPFGDKRRRKSWFFLLPPALLFLSFILGTKLT